MNRKVLNLQLSDVLRLVSTWQKRLRLEDWDIRVSIVDPKEIPNEHAEVDFSWSKHTADLKISSDAKNFRELTDSIVHELLHLHFWWEETEGVRSDLLELAFTRVCDVIAEQEEERTQSARK